MDPDEHVKLDEQDFIILNSTLTTPKTIIEIPTVTYIDSLHESCRNRRYLLSVCNDQDKEFDDNELKKLDSIKIKRDPSSDNELANKKYVVDSIGHGNFLRFNQTLEIFLKVTVGNDTYNLKKYDKIQFTDTKKIKHQNTGG